LHLFLEQSITRTGSQKPRLAVTREALLPILFQMEFHGGAVKNLMWSVRGQIIGRRLT
jgi:hypothetical protein